MSETLVDRIARHEGFRSHVYLDSQGFLSLGYGTTVGRLSYDPGTRVAIFGEGVGLTKGQARLLLKERVGVIKRELAAPV